MYGSVALLSGLGNFSEVPVDMVYGSFRGLGAPADVQEKQRQYRGYYSPGLGAVPRVPGYAPGDPDRIEGTTKVSYPGVEPRYGAFAGLGLSPARIPGQAPMDPDRIEGTTKVTYTAISPEYGKFNGLGAVSLPVVSGLTPTTAFFVGAAAGALGLWYWKKRR